MAATTVIEIEVEPLPPAFVAVMVYAVDPETADGVPEIVQVETLNERPAGRPGAIEQLEIAPPEFDGVFEEIAVPFVKVYGEPE